MSASVCLAGKCGGKEVGVIAALLSPLRELAWALFTTISVSDIPKQFPLFLKLMFNMKRTNVKCNLSFQFPLCCEG